MQFKDKTSFTPIYEQNLFPVDQSRTAFIWRDQHISFAAIKQQTEQFTARLIELGIRQGSKIGYSLDNRPEAFSLYMAISRLGACAIPLFPMIPDPGKVTIWAKCGAELIVTTAELYSGIASAAEAMQLGASIATVDHSSGAALPMYQAPAPVNISQHIAQNAESLPVMMAMSSGTTGPSKLVAITQLNAASTLKAAYQLMQPTAEGYRLTIAFPLSTSGILTCMGMFAAGITLILPDNMSPITFLTATDKYKADAIAAPPAYLEAISFIPGVDDLNFDSVTRVYSGMDFFSNKLLNAMRQRFSNLCKAGNGYGLSETATVLMNWHGETVADFAKPTHKMTPVAGIGNEFSVRTPAGDPLENGEKGELFIRGASVVDGYLGNPDATEKAFVDGWFRTGDAAIAHNDGSFSLLGRNKDIIKRGGRSIAPIEVSNHINQLNDLVTSTAVGVPHSMFGEMLWVFVVARPNSTLTSGDIMRYCRQSLPPYMVPDRIQFIEQLPKNPGVGKLDLEQLKSIALTELEQGANREPEHQLG